MTEENARRHHDLAVLGSGSAGFAAAIAARRRGLDVVMVEPGETGGTCVNVGCIPSKALLAAAQARSAGLGARFPGIVTQPPAVDWPALAGGTADLVAGMRKEKYLDLAAEYGWSILHGTGRFTGDASAPRLRVRLAAGGSTLVEAEHYLVATGSAPWAPAVPGLDAAGYLTSTSAMSLDRLPESMLVLGGNAVGLELAQLFARLGVRITVVEARERIAPFEEPEISDALAEALADDGMTIRAGTTVTGVARGDDGYRLDAVRSDGRPAGFAAEQLLVATGRRPVTAGLGLDTVGVVVGDRGQVVVDEQLRTANPRIWAAGDVTGGPQYVYVAGVHGGLVVDNAFGGSARHVDHRHLPRVTFTSPAVASAGLTAGQAAAAGYRSDSRVLPLAYVPRAIVDRDTRGLVKLVADADTGRLLGVHVLAESAGEVVAAAGYALAAGMTVQQLADAWCPYLTMAESLKLAAQTFTRDVAMLSCCAT